MAVTLTEAAARHVTRYLAKRGKGLGVRLGVKTTGCSGLAYKLEYVDDMEPEDVVFEGHGVKVMIDPKSLAYIDGTELDFVREGLNEGFRFNNPNERDRCHWPTWIPAGSRCCARPILIALPLREPPLSAWPCNGPCASTRPTSA
jgi:iron-sulfur cluster assembly protein